MESSDDELHSLSESITDYCFEDKAGSTVSFSVLPIQFNDSEKPDTGNEQVFMRGWVDKGLQQVFLQVVAWKLELQGDQPDVFILKKDNRWIKLLKAKKPYEEAILPTLVTINLLHYLKKNPDTSEKSLWDHLGRLFRRFAVRPSEEDLREHHVLIKQYAEIDETLGKSPLLPGLLVDKPRKIILPGEDARKDLELKSFIVDDDEFDEGDGGDESDEEADLFDSVCKICDNGGELLCCEGRCMRSFHATRSAGAESNCKSLGYSRAEVEAIQIFLCKNCKYNQHQCFACGKLGPSDKSAGAQVFKCVNATCGHFYHPKCVAELLFPKNEADASECEKKVASGESFMCPVHKCLVCRKGENKEVPELQFAMCRRCPKSYHRKCLPREIAFEDIEEESILQRAWDGLLPNRILIYCLDHDIDEELGTPIRNHIKFPDSPEKEKVTAVQKYKLKVPVKKKAMASVDLPRERASIKPIKEAGKISSAEEKLSSGKSGRSITGDAFAIHKKVKPLKKVQADSRKPVETTVLDDNVSSKDKTTVLAPAISSTHVKKFKSSFPVIDAQTEKRMSAFMEKETASLTLESVSRKFNMPSTHAYSARHIDKSITHGKVEGSVEAIRTALQKIEDGGSVEDAKAVCEPEIVKQIHKWGNKLKVYLAPFLHGMRYTSFGRHFTKVDKLQGIVEMLQWYVQSGDMIVDFCCGANDFSQLMKEKLDAVGKKCSFKNYDVIRPKNDFCFEKRDWMKVHPTELPTGSQLIMGLNPPFGVKAALANKFVDKALTFKPKLLILIVPSETERLDEKMPRYDLIWEDGEKLSGKSFYLPGSVDASDKQLEQWNLKPPVLYLWSRPDWTTKHKAIAVKQNHIMSIDHQQDPAEVTQGERFHIDEVDKAVQEISKEPQLSSKAKSLEQNEAKTEGSNSVDHSNKRKHSEENELGKQGSKNVENSSKQRSPKEKNEVRGEGSTSVNPNIKKKHPENHKRWKSNSRPEIFERSAADEFSDMSISPPKAESTGHFAGRQATEAFEASFANRIGSTSAYGTRSGTGQRTASVDEEIGEISRRYALNSVPPSQPDSRFGNLEYDIQCSEDRLTGYNGDRGLDAYVRGSYVNNFDGYRRSPELDLRSQSRLYGLKSGDDPKPLMTRYPYAGSDPALRQYLPPIYRLSTSSVGSSAMQRYAPRLGETNYAPPPHVTNHGPPPHLNEMNFAQHSDEMHHPRPGAHPGRPLHGRGGFYDVPGIRRDMPRPPPDSMGFVPGPHHSFPQHGSSGWLDD